MALGDLVANFVANTSHWSKPIAGARVQFTGFVSQVKTGISGLAGAFAPLASIVAPIAGAFALKHVVDAARESEAAGKKFQAVLDATGGAAGITRKEMEEFAAQLQRTTNFEDDATVAAASMLASFTNIRGETFKDTIKSAMDLSTIMGVDLPSAVRLLGKALNDPAQGMARLARIGVQLTAEQKAQVLQLQKAGKLTEAQGVILGAIHGKFGGAAAAMASPFAQIKNVVQDLSENIGFALLPVLKEVTNVVIDWAGPIQGATEQFKAFGEDVAMVFRNFTDIFQIAGIDLELAIIDAVPGAEEAFQQIGAAIYGYLEGTKAYFIAWKDDIVGGFKEIMNFGVAVGEGISASFAALKSGDLATAGTAFADAFAKELAGQKNENAFVNPFEKLIEGFAKGRREALEGFAETGHGLADELRRERERLLEGIGEREEKRRQEIEAKKPKPGQMPGLPGISEGKAGPVAAAIFGSKEAFSTIFAAMRTKDENNADKQTDLLQDQLDEEQDQTGILKDIAGKIGPQVQLIAGVV